MKRTFDPAAPELMDRPQPVTDELRRDLRNLRRLNRLTGSYRIIRRFVRRWMEPNGSMRIVDLATGSGDIPRLIADHARKISASVEIDGVDFQPSTVDIARELSTAYPEITYHCANALEFGADGSYDLVVCSLAVHHFSDADAVRLLRRCRELSRKYVLVVDLRRGWLATVGVYLLTALIFRDAMTKYDGRLSARRAFSLGELRQLAERAGWRNFRCGRFAFARMAVWMQVLD